MRFFTLRLWLGCALLITYSLSTAQIVVTSLGQSITVDFDSSTSGVCDGPIKGTGFTPDPTPGSGMLDSDVLAFEGLVDPASMDFGGTATTGDAARGISSDPTNGSGFYAFEPSGGTGRAFGFQPSTTHFNPGSMTFQFTNQTGFAINEFSFGVDVYLRGNSNRSTNLNFGFSLDGINFIKPSEEGFNTPEDPIPFFSWIGPGFSQELSINQDVCLPDPILNNTNVFIRFFIEDTGVGTDLTGDALAFDNISFTVSNRAFCAATDVTDTSVSRSNGDTEATVNWTNPTGCFDEIIVVARAAQAVTTNVSDEEIDGFPLSSFDPTTNINANWSSRSTDNEVAALSQGTVGTAGEDYFVYKGTGTSATITNLAPNIEYHFRVLAVASGCDWAKGQNVVSERAPLATQLIDFQTNQLAQSVQLQWRAIHDAAHQVTIVERSSDGINFSAIAKILATTRHAVTGYNMVDEQPLQGWNYYRLKLLDEDGTFNYSPVRTVHYHSLTEIELIPIYHENRLVVRQLPTDVSLDYIIYNYVGQCQSSGTLDTNISLTNLAKGGYIMVINNKITIPFIWQ